MTATLPMPPALPLLPRLDPAPDPLEALFYVHSAAVACEALGFYPSADGLRAVEAWLADECGVRR